MEDDFYFIREKDGKKLYSRNCKRPSGGYCEIRKDGEVVSSWHPGRYQYYRDWIKEVGMQK